LILVYHKVDLTAPTRWWVSADTFARQMDALAGWEAVHLSDYRPGSDRQCVITFDDAHENIVHHALPVLRERGLPFEVFVNGDFLGRWNTWDTHEPLARFCDLAELQTLVDGGGRIQWHTHSHPDLTTLEPEALAYELAVSEYLRRLFPPPHLQWFAYPFGRHSPAVVEAVAQRFEGAVAVLEGCSRDRFRLTRVVADQELRIGAP
jgi:peptidoglycan/xylan/chitin deacetylase (PgdA/CDA1 family)